MNIVIEQPKETVIDIRVLKSHLRIEHEYEDPYLKEILGMATEILENNIGQPILKKKYKYVYYGGKRWPCKIDIPIGCVNDVLSVKIISNGKTKNDAQFFAETRGGRTYVTVGYSRSPVEIIYSAGITGKASKAPKDLQYAVLQIARGIYDCSEKDVLESGHIKQIINSYRPISID
jgi:uncharacterized phiE125 gp8 family phage protein